jgi:hypothetical protein
MFVRTPADMDAHKQGTNAPQAAALRDVPRGRFGIGPADGQQIQPDLPMSGRVLPPRLTLRLYAQIAASPQSRCDRRLVRWSRCNSGSPAQVLGRASCLMRS